MGFTWSNEKQRNIPYCPFCFHGNLPIYLENSVSECSSKFPIPEGITHNLVC